MPIAQAACHENLGAVLLQKRQMRGLQRFAHGDHFWAFFEDGYVVGPEIFISSLREPASTKGQPVGQG
jgi:hypothetical protein